MERRDRSSARRVLLFVAVVVAAVSGYLVTVAVRGDETVAPRTTSPHALSAATSSPSVAPSASAAAVPSTVGVRRKLAGAVSASGLGGRLLARVVDAETGTVLYDRSGSTRAAPASTAKILTAAAVLDVRKSTDRLATTVVAGAAKGTVVLVGGGDPTITGAPEGTPGAYPRAARIAALAAQLRAGHVSVRRIVLDERLFTGATISPRWAPGDVPTDYAAPITAVMVDGGRDHPADTVRSGAPDHAAGVALARALGNSTIPVSAGAAPAHAKRLARVYSAPVGVLVEQMLHGSDNVIAEVLGRQVAIAEHRDPSFTGSAQAIRTALHTLGVQVGGGMFDASGLAAADRVSPAAIVGVLRLIAGARALRLHVIVAALPVAGWSGTLVGRFRSGSSRSAAGRVRAKTGTLTGVSALAGYVHDMSGRLLAFSLDADRAGSVGAVEAALDRVAGALAGCGCR